MASGREADRQNHHFEKPVISWCREHSASFDTLAAITDAIVNAISIKD